MRFLRSLALLSALNPDFVSDPITHGHEAACTAIFTSADGDGAGGGGGGIKLSDEQMNALEQRVAAIANAAVSSRMTKLEKGFDGKFGEITKLFETKFAELKPAGDGGGDGDGKGGKKVRESDVELQTLRKTVEAMRQENESTRLRFEAERQKNRAAEIRKYALQQLTGIGITDAINQELAMAKLTSDGVLGYESDDSEKIVWRDAVTGDIDANLGFSSWKKTPMAMRLMPAQRPGGPGARGGQNSGGSKPSEEQVASNLWAELAENI